MKFIGPTVHGVIDYLVVVHFAFLGLLFGFVTPMAVTSFVLAGGYLLVVLLTAFRPGALKVIPFRVHGVIDLILAPVLVALPWLLGFSDQGLPTAIYIGTGVAVFLVWLFTRWEAHPPQTAHE